jgi:hypothetical protein
MFIVIFVLLLACWVVSPSRMYDKEKFDEEKSQVRPKKGILYYFGRYFLIYIYYRVDIVLAFSLALAMLEIVIRMMFN